eukprot:350323-Chlamydomonas_euryale.AAC.1
MRSCLTRVAVECSGRGCPSRMVSGAGVGFIGQLVSNHGELSNTGAAEGGGGWEAQARLRTAKGRTSRMAWWVGKVDVGN